ncbi:hypothetical protein [Bradyrhizobium sp. RDI18]|uniref:hypothetical protein n=1 Tax=Bradyrhizobium sp. RDI18 TaxID=3367400 RepID=UPI003722F493
MMTSVWNLASLDLQSLTLAERIITLAERIKRCRSASRPPFVRPTEMWLIECSFLLTCTLPKTSDVSKLSAARFNVTAIFCQG